MLDEKQTEALHALLAKFKDPGAVSAILEERKYQEKRWGTEHDKTHTKEEWATILSVYMGKVSAETKPYNEREDLEGFLKRIAQLGAICVAAYDALLEKKRDDDKPSAEPRAEASPESPKTE